MHKGLMSSSHAVWSEGRQAHSGAGPSGLMQQAPDAACAQADLWSLGVILYELAVGQPPFYTTSIYSLIHQIVRDPVRYPPGISPAFRDFLQARAAPLRMLKQAQAERLPNPPCSRHGACTTPAGMHAVKLMQRMQDIAVISG